jgi:hypothetical protein
MRLRPPRRHSIKRNGKPLRLLVTPPWTYGRLHCTPTAIRSRHRPRHQLTRSHPMRLRRPRRKNALFFVVLMQLFSHLRLVLLKHH